MPTVKHVGGCIMLWPCFTASDAGVLLKVDGIKKIDNYFQMYQLNLKPTVQFLGTLLEQETSDQNSFCSLKVIVWTL